MNEVIFCIKILEYQAPPRAYKRLEKWSSSYEVTVYATYESDRSLLMVNLKMIKYCALTSDAWSSRTADSFYHLNILLNVEKRYNFILIN